MLPQMRHVIVLVTPFPLYQLVRPLFLVVVLAHPLITALLLLWVSREARALSPKAPTHSKLGFAVVGGMVLLLLGGLLLNLTAMLVSVPLLLLFLPAVCLAIIVALCTLVRLSRSRKNNQARPKDASPL